MRFSTTTLEAFRRWRTSRYVDEAELVATIKRELRPTPRMLLGRHYGRILEKPDAHRTAHGYQSGQYRFEPDAIEPAIETIDYSPPALLECKATRTYGAHTVVAKVDHVRGGRVTEFKVRIGDYQIEKYQGSCQWRYELDVLHACSVTYRVFRLSQPPYALLAIEELPLYPYPAMHDELQELVDAFAHYIRRRRLEAYVLDRAPFEDPPMVHGPAFEDAPTRPSRSRVFRRPEQPEQDVPLPYSSFDPLTVAPIADLPTPTLTLRPPFIRPRQASLF
jgi:hypothetical protein